MTATTEFAAALKKGARVIANVGSIKEPAYYAGAIAKVSTAKSTVQVNFDDGDSAEYKAIKSKAGILGLAIAKVRKSEIPADSLSDWLLPSANPPKVTEVMKKPINGEPTVLLAVDRKNLMLEPVGVLAQIVRNTGADLKQLAAAKASKKVFDGKEVTDVEIKALVDAILKKSKDEGSTLLVLHVEKDGKHMTAQWRFKYPASKDIAKPKAGEKLLLSKLSDNELTQVHAWYFAINAVRTSKDGKLTPPDIKVDYSKEGMGPAAREQKIQALHAGGVRSGVYDAKRKAWVPSGYEAEAERSVTPKKGLNKANSGMLKDQPAKPAAKKSPTLAKAKAGTAKGK